LAKALKSLQTLKDPSSTELKARSEPRLCGETLRPADAADGLDVHPQDATRRLVALSRNGSQHETDLRMKRIAEIRKAIAAGTYLVSAADIAEKLIRHMLLNGPPPTDAT
jgi:anti-sigma28 factor (negative regulator of flagellin synthesis)